MAHSRLLGRAFVASLAVGVALTAAGCGNQHSGPGYADGSTGGLTYAHKALAKDELMPAAYAAAKKAGTVHIALAMTRKTRTGKVCSCLSAVGDVAYGKGGTAVAMSVKEQGRRVGVRLVGGMLYLQVPGVTPAGKFVSVDPHDRKSPLASSFAGVLGDMNPVASFKNMGSAVHRSQRVGKQVMNGVTVEHYKATIETAGMLHKAGYAANAGGTPDTVDYDLWLDENHLIRRMTVTVAGVTMDETFSKWGDPVDIPRPKVGDVTNESGV